MTENQRVQDFTANWVDANVERPVEPGANFEDLQARFLADAVAAGIKLDDVNAEWDRILAELQAAVGAADERGSIS